MIFKQNGGAKFQKIAGGAVLGAGLAVLTVVILTIAADLVPPLKNWLKGVFTHHWIGKGVLASAAFFLGIVINGILPLRGDKHGTAGTLWVVFWLTAVSSATMVGFFIYEAFYR